MAWPLPRVAQHPEMSVIGLDIRYPHTPSEMRASHAATRIYCDRVRGTVLASGCRLATGQLGPSHAAGLIVAAEAFSLCTAHE